MAEIRGGFPRHYAAFSLGLRGQRLFARDSYLKISYQLPFHPLTNPKRLCMISLAVTIQNGVHSSEQIIHFSVFFF